MNKETVGIVISIVESLGGRGKKPKRQIEEHLKEWNRKD